MSCRSQSRSNIWVCWHCDGATMTRNAADSPMSPLRSSTSRTREVQPPPTHGACNRCHTDMGVDGAPGRIVLP